MSQHEIRLQKMTCDIIKARGGFAQKMSHRFLVGVVDLLVAMGPEYRPGVIEVKQDAMPKRGGLIELAVTTPQRHFLGDAHAGGLVTGVLSFLRVPGGKVAFGIFDTTYLGRAGYRVAPTEHSDPMKGPEKEAELYRLLHDYFTAYRWGE